MAERREQSNRIGRGILALVAGLVTGVALVTAEVVAASLLNGSRSPIKVETGGLIALSVYFGLIYGAAIAVFSFIAWMLLGRIGRTTRTDAILLGFIMTVLVWLLRQHDAIDDPQGLIMVAFYGVAGAVAGLVTWRVAHPKREGA
jgi:hypothetical protein